MADTVRAWRSTSANCADGTSPQFGLVSDAAGNLYGTANNAIFELTPNQSKTVWTETLLYTFCSQPNCADGDGVNGGLLLDRRATSMARPISAAPAACVIAALPSR
jgi:hypothetical protein